MGGDELIDPLEERGFDAFASDLPGLWATNGDATVAINTRALGTGEKIWRAFIWDSEPESLTVTTAAVSEAVGSTPELAVREALRIEGGDNRADR